MTSMNEAMDIYVVMKECQEFLGLFGMTVQSSDRGCYVLKDKEYIVKIDYLEQLSTFAEGLRNGYEHREQVVELID